MSIRLLLGLCIVVALVIAFWLWAGPGVPDEAPTDAGPSSGAIAFGVLGDSDSHSYQDRWSFPPGSGLRGGSYRATTLQWTEVLARLRGHQLYPGDWALHGLRRSQALAGRVLGRGPAPPRKEDYRYNFAVSGATCHDLMGGLRLGPGLAAQMRREPARWRNGVVVIRIGVNSFGQTPHLTRLAEDANAPTVQRELDACVLAIQDAVKLLHAQQPTLRIVLVGIFNNAHWARNLHRWQAPRALANIDAGLEVFNRALRSMVAADDRLAFFDDQAWFNAHWGSRDALGRPAYSAVRVGGLDVTNSMGDAPVHAVVADGHGGTALSSLWAQSLVELLNERFGMDISPISETEIETVVRDAAAVADKATLAAP